MIASERPDAASADRTSSTAAAWSLAAPCEKLIRKMDAPAVTSAWTDIEVFVAGPSVQTSFVRAVITQPPIRRAS